MVSPKHAFATFQRQSVEPLGPGQISFRLQDLGQVEHRRQCVRVLLTQQPSHGLDHLLLELVCPGQISLCVQRLGQVVHRRQCVRVVGPKHALRALKDLTFHIFRLSIPALGMQHCGKTRQRF